VELITALLACNRQLGLVGLQLRILNGMVSLLTTEVHNKALTAYLSEQSGASGHLDLTTATLEVLACIAFRQPICQAEILAHRFPLAQQLRNSLSSRLNSEFVSWKRSSYDPGHNMGLGTKNRQKKTADICKQHLREKYRDKPGLVEEFIVEFEGARKNCDVTRWGQFTDIKDIKEEMLKRLEVHFEKWLNP
jgi:hypothetical protein